MKRRGQPEGPRIIGRYDSTARVESFGPGEEHITVCVEFDRRSGNSLIKTAPPPSREQVVAQQNAPIRIGSYWLYRDHWVELELNDAGVYREDELAVLVKRVVLRTERDLARARQEIETLERYRGFPAVERGIIPDDVRIFVWRRDGGTCVRCGSRENLEFDHIIPIADGGSSTERNVQLLCEPCNRSKGRNIA